MQFNPQVNLFNINAIEIIHALGESWKTWHAEQRSLLSGGSKLIEQTLHRYKNKSYQPDECCLVRCGATSRNSSSQVVKRKCVF